MAPGESEARASTGGLLASLSRLLATVLELAQTRIEIVSTEFEEERERLRQLVIYGFWTLFFVSAGVILATLFVVVVLWENWRLHALGLFAVLYLLIGIVAAIRLRHNLRQRSRLFATTLDELRKDRAQLGDPP